MRSIRRSCMVQAVVLDWSGTAVDCGCRAPVGAFRTLFRRHGVAVTASEIRRFMGSRTRVHLHALCADPAIDAAWRRHHGARLTAAVEEALYRELLELELAWVPGHAEPVPGLLPVLETLRARAIRVGSTTGYTRRALAVLGAAAAAHGYLPDIAVSASEVPAGRPQPFMCRVALERLGVASPVASVKVGDTPLDIAAGRKAGMWTAAVAMTGNEAGLSAAELAALDRGQRQVVRAHARAALWQAGPDFVVDSVAQLPACVDAIERRLRRGQGPGTRCELETVARAFR